METFTSNLSGSIRRATVGGREFIVAPLSLIVPGVLNGSRGPLLYPEEEVRRDVTIWNGMPLTRGHPTRNGQPTSARHPDVLQEFGLGTVYNARFDSQGKRLVAEGWFDLHSLQRLDPQLLDAINRGDKIELSTGLFLDVEESQGVLNGKSYTHVSKNYRADHVAVLVGETGACSKRDGCGVNVNKEGEEETVDVDNVFCATGPGGGIDPTCSGGGKGSKESAVAAVSGLIGKDVSKSVTRVSSLKNEDGEEIGWKVNLRSSIRVTQGYHDKFSKSFEVIGDKVTANTETLGDDDMNRNQAIEYLTTNCDCWKDGKETLNKMSDAELSKMCADHKGGKEKEAAMNTQLLTANARVKELEAQAKVPPADTKKDDKTVTNTDTTKKAQTADEWFASAPPEIQAAVRNSIEIVNREAKDLIDRITAPITNEGQKKAKTEWLSKKPLDELREIASLVPAVNTDPSATFPRPYFYGSGAPSTTPTVNDHKGDDVLALPTCNWEEHSLRPANQKVGS